jgi:hypothetical protein
MKIGMAGALILVMLIASATAIAQTSDGDANAAIVACLRQCLAPATCTCDASTTNGRFADLQRQIDELREKLKPKKFVGKPRPDRIAVLTEELGSLMVRVAALEDKPDGASKADVAALKSALDELRSDLDDRIKNVEDDVAIVNDALDADHQRFAEHDAHLAAHDGWLANHGERLEKLELSPPVVTFGARVGFVELHSFGTGSNYTGAPIVGDLSFRITPKVSIATEAGISVSGDASGIGTVLRAAVRYHFDLKWSLDTGVSSVWAGYDNKLQAGYVTFLGDVGPTFTFGRIFLAHVSGLAGQSFEPRGSSFALGGMGLVGVQLP